MRPRSGQSSAVLRDLRWLPSSAGCASIPSNYLQVRRNAVGNFRLRVLFALAGFACVLNWSGCSSNSTLTITLSPAGTTAVTIKQGATQTITASVANDPSGQGVTWSLVGRRQPGQPNQDFGDVSSPCQSGEHYHRDGHGHIGHHYQHYRNAIDYSRRGVDHYYHLASRGGAGRPLLWRDQRGRLDLDRLPGC